MKPLFTVENNRNYQPSWVIRVDPTPGGILNEDGSRTHKMNFPMLQAVDYLDEPEKVLNRVAEILNEHWSDEEAKFYRHEKTGGIYELTGQCRIELTGESAVIYKSIETGQVWVRNEAEFFDGRFVQCERP